MKYENSLICLHILNPQDKFDEATVVPDKINYFWQTGNLFKLKNVLGISALCPCNDEIETVTKTFKTLYNNDTLYYDKKIETKIPIALFKEIIKFFQEAFALHKCESMVYLLYNDALKQWKYLVPIQYDLSRTRVRYMSFTTNENDEAYKLLSKNPKALEIHKSIMNTYNELIDNGFYIAGTIHSHSDFQAFHSSVDDADEMNFDGLHITVGNLTSKFTYDTRILISGVILEVSTQSVITGSIENINTDNINIDKHLLDRLIPKLTNNQATNLLKMNNSLESGFLIDDWEKRRWYSKDDDDIKLNINDDYNDDLDDYLIAEEDAVRLYNPDDGNIYWIDKENYYIFKNELKGFHIISCPDTQFSTIDIIGEK